MNSSTDGPFWDRTFRRIRDIWPLGDPSPLKERVTVDLADGDLPKLRAMIDEYLQGKGGEVSARSRAAELGEMYSVLSEKGRHRFLYLLADEYDINDGSIDQAIERRREAENDDDRALATARLRELLDPPRARLLSSFNDLEEGFKFLVDMRSELIQWAREDSRLRSLDGDLFKLLSSWFDVGFLNLQQITWNTPAALLEKLIEYEAVHEITSWDDLKNRLEDDRRCYAFFHPKMPDEPLIFVEVALVNGISTNIHDLIDARTDPVDPYKADTAIFYSISNCQKGLAGVSFGNFLIKRVVADLAGKLSNLKTFCTLSPIPGFMGWLRNSISLDSEIMVNERVVDEMRNPDTTNDIVRKLLREEAMLLDKNAQNELKNTLMQMCCHYLAKEKRGDFAHDRVANFHLTNGARMQQINWAADLSDKGVNQSAGMMVNYLYDLSHIERNHEMYRSSGEIAMSTAIKKLLR